MADVEDDDILSQAAIEEAVNGADGLEEPEQEEEGDIEEEEEDEEAAAADDTMAAAMGTDLTAQYVQAKSIPTLSRKPPGRSGVWECYYSVDIPDLEHLENLQPLDDSAYQKIHQGILSGKQYVACRACLEDTSKSLSKCLFRPTYKKCGSGGFDGTGNPGKHLRGQHLPMYQAITKERGAFRYDAFANRSVAAVAVGPMAAPPVPQEVPQQHSSTISHSTLSEPGSMVHEMSREAGKSQALAIFQEKQHRYATNNNIPLRVLTDHKACPEFRDMMIYAMQNGAALLKCPNNGLMGRMAHTNYRAKDYQTFMAAVGMHLGETDQYYMKTFGCHKSFLTVAHDVWDSNKKEILGVTIFFYNPKRGVYLRIPVALAESKDKKGEPTTNQIMDILKAFGIEDRMIYKAMNDTTNTALLVGRNLSGENAYCAMHEIQLAFSHATGQRKRYKDKVVVDEFDACQAIRKQAEETAKWLANKKSKGRWKKFTDTLSAAGRIPRAFCMSNHTRAGGEALFYASFIQARWNLHHYCIVDDTCPEVEDSKYHVMAQTLAVEFPMLKLVCFVQSDHYGANSYTAYGTYRVFASYCYSKVVWVPETRRSKATNDTEKWNGTASWYPTKFDGSPQFDEPKDDGDGSYLPSTTERIGLRTVKVEELHKIPKKLFRRIPSELRRYGASVSSCKQDDKLLAMMCNEPPAQN